jgi:hypothetical protein
MPMRRARIDLLDSDVLGRIRPWQRVHVIDSFVLPSLPGTTIALLTMANARRIVADTYTGCGEPHHRL